MWLLLQHSLSLNSRPSGLRLCYSYKHKPPHWGMKLPGFSWGFWKLTGRVTVLGHYMQCSFTAAFFSFKWTNTRENPISPEWRFQPCYARSYDYRPYGSLPVASCLQMIKAEERTDSDATSWWWRLQSPDFLPEFHFLGVSLFIEAIPSSWGVDTNTAALGKAEKKQHTF